MHSNPDMEQGVSVRSGCHGVGLSADRIQFDVDDYKMKADIRMLTMHRKCMEILPTWMVAKVLGRTSYVRT